MKPKVVIIVGPTAVGKTALSLKLSQIFNGEIISGDSMQVYRGLDIGTAKATQAEQAVAPHYLIDSCDVTQRFTVYDFQQLASLHIQQLTRVQHLPIVCGGTGFYLNALLEQLPLGGKDQQGLPARQKWLDYHGKHGDDLLWAQLMQKDPVAANQIPKHNYQRVVRALEVIEQTGDLFSAQSKQAYDATFDPLIIGLNCPRPQLYERINQRVDLMLEQGLLTEAKWLYDQRNQAPQASKGIGYKELFPYFEGDISLDEAVALIKRNSRRYAKRQLTWFNHQLPVTWYDLINQPNAQNELEAQVQSWLNN